MGKRFAAYLVTMVMTTRCTEVLKLPEIVYYPYDLVLNKDNWLSLKAKNDNTGKTSHGTTGYIRNNYRVCLLYTSPSPRDS